MRAIIQPGKLSGTAVIPPSKSQAHRLLICAALADGPSRIVCPATSRDIEATADCLRALGAEITYDGGVYMVQPVQNVQPDAQLPCAESGSTLRFLLPVAAALGGGATFCMQGRLPQRPLSPLWEELCRCGCSLTRPRADQVYLQGKLQQTQFHMAADVSSQFVSGLLMALPVLGGGEIILTGSVASEGYLDMTCDAMASFGVQVQREPDRYRVLPGRYHSPGQMTVEGDWSSAAFWLCAAALGSPVECQGLREDSVQRDRFVRQAIEQIQSGHAQICARDIPDLVPVLAVVAALTPETTQFTGAGRLRVKESDRIASTVALLRSLGAGAQEQPDGLTVQGERILPGGVCDSFADHRIAMAAAVASTGCSGPVEITGAQAVEKSYPAFWQTFQQLGGRVTLEEEP